jgi:hypothetical protein
MKSFSQFLAEDHDSEELHHEPLSDEHKRRFEAHHKKLSPATHKTLDIYKGNSDDSFNGHLRGTVDSKAHKKLGYYHTPTQLKHMDKVTSHELHAPLTVYRGFRKPYKNNGIDPHSMKPGEEFTDKGYASTSFDPKSAHSFGKLAKIHLPAGTRGHHLIDSGRKTYEGEHEYLLHRGTKFKVLKHGHYTLPGSDVKHPLVHLEVSHQEKH